MGKLQAGICGICSEKIKEWLYKDTALRQDRLCTAFFVGAPSGTRFYAFRILVSCRINSGSVPQQPPTREAPRSARRFMLLAKYSGVMS